MILSRMRPRPRTHGRVYWQAGMLYTLFNPSGLYAKNNTNPSRPSCNTASQTCRLAYPNLPSQTTPYQTKHSLRSKNRSILSTPIRLTALLPLTRVATSRLRVQPRTHLQSMHRTRRRARLRTGVRRMSDFLASIGFVEKEDVAAATPDMCADTG